MRGHDVRVQCSSTVFWWHVLNSGSELGGNSPDLCSSRQDFGMNRLEEHLGVSFEPQAQALAIDCQDTGAAGLNHADEGTLTQAHLGQACGEIRCSIDPRNPT